MSETTAAAPPALADMIASARTFADLVHEHLPCPAAAYLGRMCCITREQVTLRRMLGRNDIPALALYPRMNEEALCLECRARWHAIRTMQALEALAERQQRVDANNAARKPQAVQPPQKPPAFDPAAWWEETRGYPIRILRPAGVFPVLQSCPLGHLTALADWLLGQRPDLEATIHAGVIEFTRNEDVREEENHRPPGSTAALDARD